MKKSVFILMVLLIVTAVMIPGCTKPAPTPETTPAPTTEQPQYGGILRCSYTIGPKILGYFPEMTSSDLITGLYYAESLVSMDGIGNLIPSLAASWDVDKANKTITWHLRQGVKFQDGTDWNAEAAKWTYDKAIEVGKIQYGDLITSIEVIDDYTLRFNLTQYNNRLLQSYGYGIYFFSPTATETNGKEWARSHPVGTGAFKVVDFKRDAYWKLEKNENYWRPGRPYLDGMDIRFIPQETTGSATLEAGELDAWFGPQTKKTVLELIDKGFKTYPSGLWLYNYVPDAANPDSPLANKKVRQAIEYAIDREALAKAITLGLGEASYQMAPPGAAVYDPDYKGRPYDPEKAKQLLAEAGYADGFQTSIYCINFADLLLLNTAVSNFLKDVGIEAKVESADMGRFLTMQTEGWKNGLNQNLVMITQPNYLVHFLDSFGPLPTRTTLASFGRSPEYEALCDQVKLAQDDESERAIVKEMIGMVDEEATLIPLFLSPVNPMLQPYVHPYIYPETGIQASGFYFEWWMEKH